MSVLSKLFGSSDEDGTSTESDYEKPDLKKAHQNVIAPTGINIENPLHAKIGEHFVRTYFINGWPDSPRDMFLQKAMHGVNLKNDISIHISPYDTEEALDQLEDDVQDADQNLQDDVETTLGTSLSQKDDLRETVEVFQTLRQTETKLFDVSMYVTIRGDTEEELEKNDSDIVKKLWSSPALSKPVNPRNQLQLIGFKSTAPLMQDKLRYYTKDEFTSNEMLGGAVGAMFPFSSTKLIEPGGIEYGMHAGNSSPVIINRFEERDTGYNQLTFGKIGSGKSFGTKLDILRTYINRDDTKIIMLDPVSGFNEINDALGGEKITVGGKIGLNPLEINETPEEILEKDRQFDPYSMQKDKVMDFFEMFFAERGVKLKDSRGVLEDAVEIAYQRKGIKRDPETHSRESPTVIDVIKVIQEMVQEPGEFTEVSSATGVYEKDIEKDASRLLRHFTPFGDGGQYENLTKPTSNKLDFSTGEVFYLDLHQGEGSGKRGLMMYLILSKVYDHAKQTDDKVFFCIDEAHYLTKDSESLEFLEQVVRHSRHSFLSINFITQNVDDFFSHEKAHQIAQNCSLRKFHRVETGLTDEIVRLLGMTPQEASFVREAQPGDSDVGYSEALIGVEDKGYVPTRVMASGFEEDVINEGLESVGIGVEDQATEPSQNLQPFQSSDEPVSPVEIRQQVENERQELEQTTTQDESTSETDSSRSEPTKSEDTTQNKTQTNESQTTTQTQEQEKTDTDTDTDTKQSTSESDDEDDDTDVSDLLS